MKKILCIVGMLPAFGLQAQTRIGINTPAPSHLFHVKGTGTADPLRIEGLQAGSGVLIPLVADATGVIKKGSSVPPVTKTGVRVRNNSTSSPVYLLPNNNTYVTVTGGVEDYDDLNEYAGGTFTASQPGMYLALFSIYPEQRDGSTGGTGPYPGDNAIAFARISSSVGPGTISAVQLIPSENTNNLMQASTNAKYLVQLPVGGTISFSAKLYASNTNRRTQYKIHVIRLD